MANIIALTDTHTALTDENKTVTNIQVGAGFTLLKANFTAAFERNADGYRILILPKDGEESEGMTIHEIVQEISDMMSNTSTTIDAKALEDGMKNALENSVDDDKKSLFKVDEIKIKIKQAFLYVDGKTGGKTEVEFAFSLLVDMSGFMPGIKLINIEDIYLSIWNTTREKILSRMELGSIKELLDKST